MSQIEAKLLFERPIARYQMGDDWFLCKIFRIQVGSLLRDGLLVDHEQSHVEY